MKKLFKNAGKKDLTSVYIALLSLAVIIVVFFLAYLSKMSKLPQQNQQTQPTVVQNGKAVMNGQQTATITIVPAGSAVPPTTTPSANPSLTQQNGVQANLTILENSGSTPANTRVKFKIDHFKKLALQPLIFDIFDEGGKAYAPTDLKDVNGQKVNFVVVSANLREFQHLNPTYKDGKWNVLANLPNVGTYYAYTDIAPVKGPAVVLRSNLVVQKETSETINYPGLTPSLFALNGAFKVQLALKNALVLQQSVLSFQITSGGKASVLGALMGSFGHVILFRQGNIDSYTVVAPQSTGNPQQGTDEFMTTFVKGGRYTAFAEFKLGTKVYTFPITFDVSG